jgi:alpha-glucosidase
MSDDETHDSSGRLRWWQRAVVYQIAPMSFQDSDGDGKGDLEGIMRRLSYLEWLGIDAVWLCPLPLGHARLRSRRHRLVRCQSAVRQPRRVDRLLAAMHARGIKVLLDFVHKRSSSDPTRLPR